MTDLQIKIKEIEQKLDTLFSEIALLKETKKNKSICGYEQNKPQYKEDIGFCKKCGRHIFLCICPEHITQKKKWKEERDNQKKDKFTLSDNTSSPQTHNQ
jgi:hypothetical protein